MDGQGFKMIWHRFLLHIRDLLYPGLNLITQFQKLTPRRKKHDHEIQNEMSALMFPESS
jgi:hypothetical protein